MSRSTLASFKRTTGSTALFGPESAAFEHLNSLFIAMMKNQTDINRFLLHEQYHSLSLKNCFNVWPETKSTFFKYSSPGFILEVRSCPRVRSPSQSIAGQDSHLVIHKPVVLNRGRTGADIIRRKVVMLKGWAVVQAIVTLPRLCSCVRWPRECGYFKNGICDIFYLHVFRPFFIIFLSGNSMI